MPFDDRQLAGFRRRLLELQQELQGLRETGAAAAQTVELDQTRVGRLSRMDALQGQAMSQERDRRRQLELQKIAAALRRIDAGDFGFCMHCGEPVAAGRLELDPATPLCIACAEKSDRISQ